MIIIPTGVRWYFIVILTWISLMIRDVEHLIMYLLALCLFQKNSYLETVHFFIRLVVFAAELYESAVYIYIEYWPLIRVIICEYFLLFSKLPLHFVGCFLCCKELFSLMLSHMFIFYFCYLGFDVKSKKIIAKTDFKELTTSVVLQEFYGLGL